MRRARAIGRVEYRALRGLHQEPTHVATVKLVEHDVHERARGRPESPLYAHHQELLEPVPITPAERRIVVLQPEHLAAVIDARQKRAATMILEGRDGSRGRLMEEERPGEGADHGR